MRNIEFVGNIIGSLKINRYYTENKRQYFECICWCGQTFSSRCESIKNGTTKSCGCKTGDLISTKNSLPDNSGAINLVLRHYKQNAKKRNLSFFLTRENFIKFIFSNCHYCGAPPTISTFTSSQLTRRDKKLSYNGIDRIDNSIGYVDDNCITCCSICNRAKSDLSSKEFGEWIKRLVNFNA